MIGPVVLTLLALIVAGIVHLATVLAMPSLAPRDGLTRLAGLVRENRMTVVPDDEVRRAMPFADPSVALAGCSFALDRGPVRVRLRTGSAPVAVVFVRKGAGVFHSLSDKAAIQGALDAVLATPAQLKIIRSRDTDDDPVQEIRIASPEERGLVVVRALVPVPSMRADIERLLAAATCEAESLEDAG